MIKKPKNWETGDDFGSDILGFGQFQFIPGGSGKSKSKTQIGFVRQKDARVKNNQTKGQKTNHPRRPAKAR